MWKTIISVRRFIGLLIRRTLLVSYIYMERDCHDPFHLNKAFITFVMESEQYNINKPALNEIHVYMAHGEGSVIILEHHEPYHCATPPVDHQ